jgi:uncharacterized BrkB/YihY/UPF0761 family membrane protein
VLGFSTDSTLWTASLFCQFLRRDLRVAWHELTEERKTYVLI